MGNSFILIFLLPPDSLYSLHSHHSKTLILHSPKLIERTSAQAHSHASVRGWGGGGGSRESDNPSRLHAGCGAPHQALSYHLKS